MSELGASISFIAYAIGAIAAGLAAVWIATRGAADRPDRHAAIVALALTANWCFAAASFGPERPIVLLTEIARNLGWLFVLFRMFATDGRDESIRMVRPAVGALAFVECLQFVLVLLARHYGTGEEIPASIFEISTLFRILVAIGAIVLIHNLYVGAAPSSRQILRWNTAAMAGLWAFGLNFYTVAYLTHATPMELVPLRGIAAALVAVPFAVGYNPSAAGLQFRPSRAATLQLISLFVVAVYLLLMLALAASLDMLRGDMARLTQVGLVIAAGALALVWLPSDRLRGWLRVTAVKHLFKHRYDYRNEWIRFTHTVGRGGYDGKALQERVIKALADITDSPSGMLLMPDDDGRLDVSAYWRWEEDGLEQRRLPTSLAAILEREGLVVDLEEVRAGVDHHGESAFIPEWLVEDPRAWALVPLLHFERLIGVVVLSRPLIARRLDWEDFDLFGVVGRQVASYLAEQSGQTALLEAGRFDEFNRRMAFVMHDIKNLSSQMSLLVRNAEKHADNPEFRRDMLVTLRNSTDKLNHLLARLGRYGSSGKERREPFALDEIARTIADRYGRHHPVAVLRRERVQVIGDREALEQAVAHLVQNAIDASDANAPISLEVFSDGVCGKLSVVDSGKGMTPQFLRNELFKPFVSSKDGGFGIGAFEARETIRAMGGRLEVESRPSVGSRFSVTMPLQSTARMLEREANPLNPVESEIA